MRRPEADPRWAAGEESTAAAAMGCDDEAKAEPADDEVYGECGVGEGGVPAHHQEERDGGHDEAEGGREPVAEPGNGEATEDSADGDRGSKPDQPEATLQGFFAHDRVGDEGHVDHGDDEADPDEEMGEVRSGESGTTKQAWRDEGIRDSSFSPDETGGQGHGKDDAGGGEGWVVGPAGYGQGKQDQAEHEPEAAQVVYGGLPARSTGHQEEQEQR